MKLKTETRNKMLGIIHMQKKKLNLCDEDYQTLLYAITGKDSAKDLTEHKELTDVISALNRELSIRGMSKFYYNNRKRGENVGTKKGSFLFAVQAKAHAVLGSDSDKRLQGFLQKMNKTTLEECDSQELRRVMGLLSVLQKQK